MICQGRIALAIFVALAACSEDTSDSSDAACGADDIVNVTDVPMVTRRGNVTIRDVVDTTLNEQGQSVDLQEGRIQASFGTVTATGAPPATIEWSFRCAGVVSRSSTSDSVERQNVGSLTVAGVAGGPLVVDPVAVGSYVRLGALLLLDATETIDVSAPGAGFVAFSTQISRVAPLLVQEPATDGTGALEAGELEIRWEPGSGDYVELRIEPVFTEGSLSGGQVICQIADDGCFRLPVSATNFLLSSNTPTFSMSMQRTNLQVLEPAADTAIRVSVVSEVRATLQNGVGQ